MRLIPAWHGDPQWPFLSRLLNPVALYWAVLILLCAPSASAEQIEDAFAAMYASGVREYQAGDYQAAIRDLSVPITQGSKDPRHYFFRGLAYMRQSKPAEAESDFEIGAALESVDVSQFYNVGGALEPVQGRVRVKLESFRVAARLATIERRQQLDSARYEERRRSEAEVLRPLSSAPPSPVGTDDGKPGHTPTVPSKSGLPAKVASGIRLAESLESGRAILGLNRLKKLVQADAELDQQTRMELIKQLDQALAKTQDREGGGTLLGDIEMQSRIIKELIVAEVAQQLKHAAQDKLSDPDSVVENLEAMKARVIELRELDPDTRARLVKAIEAQIAKKRGAKK